MLDFNQLPFTYTFKLLFTFAHSITPNGNYGIDDFCIIGVFFRKTKKTTTRLKKPHGSYNIIIQL